MKHAFVKVVESKGKGLFYQAVYTDYEGKLWNVLNNEDYPYYWGFSKMENALKVVRQYNWNQEAQCEEQEGEPPVFLARRLAGLEREEA